MKHLKKLTLLHSNDLHGDFLAEKVDDKLVGGVSRLSGYVNKVRNEEKNVIYSISGDMFRGSLIDSEFQGLSTIEIMNLLAPDVATIGNHEADYGLAHMLFIEKCAAFPIVNANMYIKYVDKRLFNSHFIKEIDGMKVLFIGILLNSIEISLVAVALYAAVVLFQLVTLPVEFDASKRGLAYLRTQPLMSSEVEASSGVLRACALTYVAAALIAVLQLLWLFAQSRN